MIFKRNIQRYGRTPPAETPYSRAGQVWDDRIGSARVQARNWRAMAFGTLSLSLLMAGGLVWQSLQSRVTPYVVEVDRLGEAKAFDPAQPGYQPTDPQIAWHLAKFIENVRSVSLDPVLMRRDWLAAYAFATARGARFLGDYARTANPFGSVGERTVSVQVTSVVRASERSFQVKWTENIYENGQSAGASHWTAILTILSKAPVSADALRQNPLGIFVDAIDWTRELDGKDPALPRTPDRDPVPPPAGWPARPASPASEIQP